MTTQPIVITVHGRPAPQGSKRAFAVRGRGGVPTGRIAVIDAALAAGLDAPHDWPLAGPLRLGIVFALPRPKSHYRTGKNAAQLRDTAPRYPVGVPDLSKLLRSTEDALTDAAVWRDDSQVVAYSRLEKVYAGHYGDHLLTAPGAMITIRPA